MNQDELNKTFDQQAAGYDNQWARLSPIRDALHLLLRSYFAELPQDASMLCVGAGTGAELAFLAGEFPEARFTVVEPSSQMLEVCRQRAEQEGFASRSEFHEGYVASLDADRKHNAATCFLVSQFLLDPQVRTEFFRAIAYRLKPGGLLASSDLVCDTSAPAYNTLLQAWMRMMAGADIPPERIEQIRQAYATDVVIVPPTTIESIFRAAGFASSVQFFQAGLIGAWISCVASR